jgi:hypothetical protein
MRRWLMASPFILAAALAACSKPASTPAAKPASTGVSNEGPAVAPPMRKAGLWEQTMTRDGGQSMGPMGAGMKLCLDAATDAQMHVFGRQFGRGMCQQQSVSRGPDGSYAFASSCDLPNGGKVVSKGAASGDFNSKYVVRMESDVTGAMSERRNGHHTMEMTGVWKGPCPADMKPGDMLLGNGVKVNVSQMMNWRRGAGGGSSGDSGE